jgi:hypothetical protein
MKKSLFAILVLVLAALIAVGSVTVIGPCVHADGSAAACTGTGRAILIDGCVMAALALLALLIRKPGIRIILFAAAFCAAVTGILLPGTLMPLCKMDTMHCRAVMQPAVMILSGAAAITSLTGMISEQSKSRRMKG